MLVIFFILTTQTEAAHEGAYAPIIYKKGGGGSSDTPLYHNQNDGFVSDLHNDQALVMLLDYYNSNVTPSYGEENILQQNKTGDDSELTDDIRYVYYEQQFKKSIDGQEDNGVYIYIYYECVGLDRRRRRVYFGR